MLGRPRLDKDGLTLPAWALSLILLLLGWGVTLEVRLGRMEDGFRHVTASVEALQGAEASGLDHDRLVAIEARVTALLDAQQQLLAFFRPGTRPPSDSTPPPDP